MRPSANRCPFLGPHPVFTSDAIAMIHEAALGSLRDIDRVATAALRESTRRKRKLVERDAVSHVVGVLGV
jgi:general secretion pathway protein A